MHVDASGDDKMHLEDLEVLPNVSKSYQSKITKSYHVGFYQIHHKNVWSYQINSNHTPNKNEKKKENKKSIEKH